MIIIFTRGGIIAVEGNAATVDALKNVGLQLADDLAGVASQVDNAGSLVDLVRNSLSGNGLGNDISHNNTDDRASANAFQWSEVA